MGLCVWKAQTGIRIRAGDYWHSIRGILQLFIVLPSINLRREPDLPPPPTSSHTIKHTIHTA